MKRESARPGPAESVPLREKLRKPAAIITALGILALGSPVESIGAQSDNGAGAGIARFAEPMKLVGYNSGEILNDSYEAAEKEAESIAATGANIVRVQIPYTVGGVEVDNDINRLCNAVNTATKNNLHVEFTMAGHKRDAANKPSQGLGYFASNATEYAKVETTIFNMLSRLAKPTSSPEAKDGGCAPELEEVDIGFNEANSDVFLRPQFVNGKWVAPEKEVNLLAFLNQRLPGDLTRAGMDLKVNLIGGELRARNAVAFIKAMGRVITAQKIKVPFQVFSFHIYTGNSSSAGVDSFKAIVNQTRKTFGDNMPIRVNEIGAYSQTPADKAHLYNIPLPVSVKPLSAKDQGRYYSDFIAEAACMGIEDVEIFHKSDDSNDILRTGTSFPDGTSKESEGAVINAFDNARAGVIPC